MDQREHLVRVFPFFFLTATMKKALNIDEQIALLKSRGMTIADEAKAAEVLLDIGYYRLGFYWYPFEVHPQQGKPRHHQFLHGTTFDDAVRLYYFDRDLRNIVVNVTGRIEVNFRTALIYHGSIAYRNDPTWFATPSVVGDDFLSKIDSIYGDIRRNDVIMRHHKRYPSDKYAPAWKTLEFLAQGQANILFNSLKDDALKETIVARYGLRPGIFSRYINVVRIVRNRCAHGHYLYNFHPAQSIPNSSFLHLDGHNNDVVGCLMVVDRLLGCVSASRSLEFRSQVQALVKNPKNATILPHTSHLLAVVKGRQDGGV